MFAGPQQPTDASSSKLYYFGSHQPSASQPAMSLGICAMLPIQHMCHPQWRNLADWFQIYRSARCDAMWANQYSQVNAMLKTMLKVSIKCGTLPQCSDCLKVVQGHLEFVSSFCMRMFTTSSTKLFGDDTDEEVDERSISDEHYDSWVISVSNKKSNKEKTKPVQSIPKHVPTFLPATTSTRMKKTRPKVVEEAPASPSSTASTIEATRSHRKSFVRAAAKFKYCNSDSEEDVSDDNSDSYAPLITKSLMPVPPSPAKPVLSATNSRRKSTEPVASTPLLSATSSSAPPNVEEQEVQPINPIEKGVDDTLSDDQVAPLVGPKRKRASRAKKPVLPIPEEEEQFEPVMTEESILPFEVDAEPMREEEKVLNDLWAPEEEITVAKPKRRLNMKRTFTAEDEPAKPKRRRNVKKRSLEEMTPNVVEAEATHHESSSADFQPPMPKRWSSSMLLSKDDFDDSDAEPVLASNEIVSHDEDLPIEPKQPRVISTRVNLRGNATDSGKLFANVRRSKTEENRFVAELKRKPTREISLLDIVGPIYLPMFSKFAKLSDKTYVFFINDKGMALFKSRIAALTSIGEIVEIENA